MIRPTSNCPIIPNRSKLLKKIVKSNFTDEKPAQSQTGATHPEIQEPKQQSKAT